ncbi:MAG: hypothetical protein ACXVP4_14630 [Bacteroidia bacterium]
MKTIVRFIICQIACIFPLISQSQTNTAPVKPATDACPSWNKKQPVASKADYFAYLSKRSKTADENNFYTPKYQNYNAANAAAKKQNKSPEETKYVGINQAKAPAIVPEKGKQTVAKQPAAEPDKKAEETPEPAITNKTEEPVKEKGTTVSASKKEEKNETKKNTPAVHYERKHWLRKIGFRKKRAADCPSF